MDDDPLVSELLEKCALVKRPEPATKRR